MQTKNIPEKLQAILWSVNIDQLDIEHDKNYIIHQVLAYGTMEDVVWLFKTYSKQTIITVFINKPMKNYSKPVFNFVKNYLLNIKLPFLNQSDYVTSLSG